MHFKMSSSILVGKVGTGLAELQYQSWSVAHQIAFTAWPCVMHDMASNSLASIYELAVNVEISVHIHCICATAMHMTYILAFFSATPIAHA